MRLVLLTNMPSYHQVQLGVQFAKLLGAANFRLVFEKGTSDDRQEMGWSDDYQGDFILRMWESESNRQQAVEWIENADVVIQGRFPMRYVRARIGAGKLTFAYQERFWKRKFSYPKILLRLPRIVKRYWSVNRINYHLLAAGAYVAPDLAMLGCFRGRSWKYGYFITPTELIASEPDTSALQTIKILWCARFSAVKRPNDALSIVQGLIARGLDCHLTMVGDGEQKNHIEQQVAALELSNSVSFTGWQSAPEVAHHMQQADVLLMTSGFGEGWALVINEAMSHGCMVLANRAVGAAPWLIEPAKTGFTYGAEDLAAVLDEIAALPASRVRAMGRESQRRHHELWAAPVAAERLIRLADSLLAADGKAANLFDEGPCSPT